METSESMPQLIGPLSDKEVKDAIATCKGYFKRGMYKVLQSIGSVHILAQTEFVTGNTGFIFLVNKDTSDIEYFVRYKNFEFPENVIPTKQVARQVLVYRNMNLNSSASTGIAQEVFWKYLLPKFGCLVSDSQQTLQGKAFWQHQVKKALEQKRTVRFIDTNLGSYTDITSWESFVNLDSAIWGSSKWFQRIILAIF